MIDRLPRDVQASILALLPDASSLTAGMSCKSMAGACSRRARGRPGVRCLLGDDTLPPSGLAEWAASRAGAPLGDARFLLEAAAARRSDLFRLSITLGAPLGAEALEAAIEFLPLGEPAWLLRRAGPVAAKSLVEACSGVVGAALRYHGEDGERDDRLARFEWCVLNGFSWKSFEVCRWAAERGEWRLAVRARRMSGRGYPSWAVLANICAAHGHREASLRLAPPGGGPPAPVVPRFYMAPREN